MRIFPYTIFLAFVCLSSFGQNSKPLTSPVPNWVTINTIDYKNTLLDKEAEGGSLDLDYEEQINLSEQSTYRKHCTKILSGAGVQDNSQVSIYFDPTFQKLFIHTIEIIRDGVSINKLNIEKIKVVHVETDLDSYIYNGQLEANFILDDVRKGDIIQYTYTLKGFNPIFQNKYQHVFETRLNIPICNLYYKLIIPLNRSLNIKNDNDTITPTINNSQQNKTYEWRRINNHAVHAQDQLPDWYDPYSSIMISEYNSWAQVSNWANLLFPKNAALPAALKQKINYISQTYKSPEEKTIAALRFVEDDIRYMGIEIGIHSHKPASPAQVFNQRFGDCKEKSYLLCTMLNAMNINACPVLINTDYKKAITTWLPAATDFNHCTVRATINNKNYWLDPTISYQRGSLSDISYPDYQYGLAVTDSTTSLSAIQPQGENLETVKEIFNQSNYYEPCRLKVTTTYKGSYADNVRDDFNSNSNYEMQKTYLNFYKSYFDGITADSLTYADDDSTGIFITTEYYSIDSFWTLKKDNKKYARLSCFNINTYLKKPKATNRIMPVGISFPVHFKEQVDITLPGAGWDLKDVEEQVHNTIFAYTEKSTVFDNRIIIDYDYERLKDHVTVDEAKTFFSDLQKIDDSEDYELSWRDDMNYADTGTSTKTLVNIIVILLVIVSLIVRWTQKR